MSTFVSVTEARAMPGLRIACLRGVPSPWTEAAKAIFRVKGLDCQYAGQAEDDPDNAIAGWAGNSSVPVVAFEDEPLRTGWAEILLLAERLAPAKPLLPDGFEARAEAIGLSHEICGEMGLGWAARNFLVGLGFESDGASGFHPKVGKFLAGKYGYRESEDYRQRVIAILEALSARIAGKPFLVGSSLTAVDIYWAAFSNLVAPLPAEKLPMHPRFRAMWESVPDDVKSAASGELMAHRDRIYETCFELPVPL
ncbi:MAG: glutathione S-transferase family protein [Minwuia sp.]|uniref:glutathione S-transferase family protein n=1 Tax=Minwuia sp. TaxID=2493630 RepID=UPI003A8AD0DE